MYAYFKSQIRLKFWNLHIQLIPKLICSFYFFLVLRLKRQKYNIFNHQYAFLGHPVYIYFSSNIYICLSTYIGHIHIKSSWIQDDDTWHAFSYIFSYISKPTHISQYKYIRNPLQNIYHLLYWRWWYTTCILLYLSSLISWNPRIYINIYVYIIPSRTALNLQPLSSPNNFGISSNQAPLNRRVFD